MRKLKEIKGYIFPCELKNWKQETEIMLPSKEIQSGIECECEEKNHKSIRVKVCINQIKEIK